MAEFNAEKPATVKEREWRTKSKGEARREEADRTKAADEEYERGVAKEKGLGRERRAMYDKATAFTTTIASRGCRAGGSLARRWGT